MTTYRYCRSVYLFVVVNVAGAAFGCGGVDGTSKYPVPIVGSDFCKALLADPPIIVATANSDGGIPVAPGAQKLGGGAPAGGGAAPMSAFLDDAGAGYTVLSDPTLRHRAAAYCSCLSQRERSDSSANGSWTDVLTIGGAIGTIGGGAVTAIASSTKDDDKRATWSAVGTATFATGSLAFGIAAGLALAKRAQSHDSAAEDEQFAAAILADDTAPASTWTTAWAVCSRAESLVSSTRPGDPMASYNFTGDAGPPHADGGDDADVDSARRTSIDGGSTGAVGASLEAGALTTP